MFISPWAKDKPIKDFSRIKSRQKIIEIKNAYITFKKDIVEIVSVAYSKLVKYTAFFWPSTLKKTLYSIPLNKNSSRRPKDMINIRTHISKTSGAVEIFILPGWNIKNSYN